MAEIHTEILVIGGGPAGLAAAKAASSHGKKVTVIDENPQFGGQIWRAEKSNLNEEAKSLIDSLDANGVQMLASCSCVAALPGKRILAQYSGQVVSVAYDRAIIATGARERFVPFAGWTLPGVFGAGGLQALVKGGYDVSGKRIVVAGTGPLLLAVAAYLKRKGGNVLLIAEQTSRLKLLRLAFAALRVRGKVKEALALRREVRGIPYRTSTMVTRANGTDSLSAVVIRKGNSVETIECDILASGFHLAPNTEVAEILGCAIGMGCVMVDDRQWTTVPDVLCAGEPTRVGGLELSLLEGKMAGLVAAGRPLEADTFEKERRKHDAFAGKINAAFRIDSDKLRDLQTDDTIVCRCEDVPYRRIKGLGSFDEAKLQTRLGMGFCQGRVCGPACEALFGWDETNRPRPPLVPLKIESLANFETENK